MVGTEQTEQGGKRVLNNATVCSSKLKTFQIHVLLPKKPLLLLFYFFPQHWLIVL